MSSRRLVRSGKTSFTIAMPIDWVRQYDLDAGDEVQIHEVPDGSLSIHPPLKADVSVPAREKRVILIDELSEIEVRNEVLIAYVQGSGLISLEGGEVSSRASRLTSIIQEFIGLAVIEQGPEFILVKDFFVLDQDTIPFSVVRKMSYINRSVFDSLKESFSQSLSKGTLYEVEQLVRQNTRLRSVVQKSGVSLLASPSQMRAHNQDSIFLMKLPQYANGFARIGEQLHEIAETLFVLDYDASEAVFVKKLFSRVHSAHQEVLEAIINSKDVVLKNFLSRADTLDRSLSDAAGKLSDALYGRLIALLWALHVNLRELAFVAVF